VKVYIGKYPNNWWTTRNWAERVIARRNNKEFGFEVDEEDYDWVDRLISDIASHWQSVLNVTINPILRKFYKRKIKIRIDRCDTWSMDHTLSLIILPMLKQLKATKHGSPWVEDVDVPHLVKDNKTKKAKKSPPQVRSLDIDEEDQHSDVHVRWEWVLNEMIWAFEQVTDENEGDSHYRVPYKDGEELERVYWTDHKTDEKHYLTTEEETRKMGRYDPDLAKAYQQRVNRGLTFFGKYFQNLWD
jgi:hypothetical protein